MENDTSSNSSNSSNSSSDATTDEHEIPVDEGNGNAAMSLRGTPRIVKQSVTGGYASSFRKSDFCQPFNGFEHNLEPEEITGHTTVRQDNRILDMYYVMKWKNYGEEGLPVLSRVLRQHAPKMAVDYWEQVTNSNPPFIDQQ